MKDFRVLVVNWWNFALKWCAPDTVERTADNVINLAEVRKARQSSELETIAQRAGINIKYIYLPEDLAGFLRPDERTIYVSSHPSMTKSQQDAVIQHELCEWILNHR